MSIDKLEAIYVFCMNYHEGQWSQKYRILSKISSKYNMKLSNLDIACIENYSPIYKQLVAKHA